MQCRTLSIKSAFSKEKTMALLTDESRVSEWLCALVELGCDQFPSTIKISSDKKNGRFEFDLGFKKIPFRVMSLSNGESFLMLTIFQIAEFSKKQIDGLMNLLKD